MLDETTINKMVKMRENGKTLREIGKRFGISRQRVCQIFKKIESVDENDCVTYTRKKYNQSSVIKKIKFVGLRNELESKGWSISRLCDKSGANYQSTRRNFQSGTLPSNPDDINRIIKTLNSTYEKLFMEVDKDSEEE